MSQSNQDSPVFEHSFSVFTLGLTIGAVGALLLGSKQGRKICRQVLDSLSKSEVTENIIDQAKQTLKDAGEKVQQTVSSSPEKTFHPPTTPIPPSPSPSTSSPRYFTQD